MNRRAVLLSAAALMAAGAGPACSQAVFAAADSAPTTFDFFRESRIFLSGQVNGHATDLMLDSGAGQTTIDKAWADSIGLKAAINVPVQGAGGSVQAGFVTGLTIDVGGFQIRNTTAFIIDLSGVAAKLGRPMPVVLGRGAFTASVVDIDFPGRRIAFRDPKSFSPPPGAIRLDLTEIGTGVRSVKVSIEGRPPVAGTFDLGNGAALSVSQAYGAAEKLLQGRRSTTTLSGGVGGLSVNDMAVVRSLAVAGIELHDVPATFNRRTGDLPSQGVNVGISVWKRFRLLIDYSRSALWLVPDAAALAAPFRKDRAGLGSLPAGDHLDVLHVMPGGPAEALGFKVGDKITAIDGRPVTPEFFRGPDAFWTAQPAGTRVVLTMADGSRRTLVLKDYF